LLYCMCSGRRPVASRRGLRGSFTSKYITYMGLSLIAECISEGLPLNRQDLPVPNSSSLSSWVDTARPGGELFFMTSRG